MSDEVIEEEMLEEEAPLSAEELFEQHKAEIEAAFEEKGFFRRMSDMFSGLSKPHSSAEFKNAKTELQRLIAPIAAILLPVLGGIILIVVTAVQGQVGKKIEVEVARAQEEEAELEEEQEQEEIVEQTPPEETVEMMVDTPVVNAVADVVTPSATPQNEPVSVKPASQDSVALIKSPVTMKSMTGSRTPGSIGKFTSGGAGYGDATTEKAVLMGLRWLKKTQLPTGTWGNGGAPVANAGLAILAFLAHGETPASKEFGPTVMKAMQFLIDDFYMDPKSGLAKFKHGSGSEYDFLIATYALCEAYGMTRNPNTKIVAMQTLQRIVDNQSATGGWDYNMKKNSVRDDMSYAGWALQALKAGKMAGMHPKGLDECIKKAIKCLKTRNFRNGGFNYTAGGGPTGLTATGCLAMQLLGFMNEPEVKAALDTMRLWQPSFDGNKGKKLTDALPAGNPQYYCYYASQCKYQAGMCQGATPANVKTWQDWNTAMKALYPRSIIILPEKIPGPDGKPRQVGYWKFKDTTCGGEKATTMATCLCALQLMVYYRYLPTTQTKAAKANAEPDDEGGKDKKKKKKEVEVDVDI